MIIKKHRSNFQVNLPDRERGMIQKGILHITKELDPELQIRTGYTESEYLALEEKLAGLDNSEYLLSEEEIMMIHQMLNEIWNG